MRILFLTPQLPYPPRSGGSLRAFNLIKNLASQHEVHLVSFYSPGDEFSGTEILEGYCTSIKMVPVPAQRSTWARVRDTLLSPFPDMALRLESREFVSAARDALEAYGFDLVQIEGLEMVTPLLWQWISGLRRREPLLVLDQFNAEFLLQKRAFEVDSQSPGRWLGAAYSWIQWKKLERYESRICRGVQGVLVVSEEDRRGILTLAPELDVAVVPNGVDSEFYAPRPLDERDLSHPRVGPYVSEKALLFTGTMDFRPNVDAVGWFCREILPEIMRHVPQGHLYIVGRNPTEAVRSLAGPHVTVVGAVEDDRPYFWGASAYVLPMRFGGGVRLKLLQAMACGLPVITTSLGMEGVAVTHGQEVLMGDSARGFADRVVEVLLNPSLGQKIGVKGRELAQRSYDWRVIVPKLEEVYGKLMGG